MATKNPTQTASPTPTNPDMAAMVAAQAKADERPVMPEPAGGWPADEYTGKPGSYVRDPYTGIRSPAADAAE